MQGLPGSHPRTVVLACMVWLMGYSAAAAQQKATVVGTATANMRAGAGVEHALKMTLKEGDQVSIERTEGEWYLVSAADGQKGFIHTNLLKLAADAPPQPTTPKTASAVKNQSQAKESGTDVAPAALPTKALPTPAPSAAPKPAPVHPPIAPEAKSKSILQMVEGHETEINIGLIIAAIAFALGWLCGGSFYARRERKWRHKLRF